jgi:hypothetical protein
VKKLVLLLSAVGLIAVVLMPSNGLGAEPRRGSCGYETPLTLDGTRTCVRVGGTCSARYESVYEAHSFSCDKGRLEGVGVASVTISQREANRLQPGGHVPLVSALIMGGVVIVALLFGVPAWRKRKS